MAHVVKTERELMNKPRTYQLSCASTMVSLVLYVHFAPEFNLLDCALPREASARHFSVPDFLVMGKTFSL